MAEKAAAFLAQQKKDAPFFLYVAFAAPHVPIDPAPEFRGKSEAGLYGDYIQQLDHCAGVVLDASTNTGSRTKTLVIFSSDNGAVFHARRARSRPPPNGALLGQKTDAWEGGHRVPLLARWPGRIPAGSERRRSTCRWTGWPRSPRPSVCRCPRARRPMGRAIWRRSPTRPTPRPCTRGGVPRHRGHALRQGDWVFLPKQGSGGMTVQVPPGALGPAVCEARPDQQRRDAQGKIRPGAPPVQLYNLATDLPQATNLASKEPARTAAMKKRLEELRGAAPSHARPLPRNKPTPTYRPLATRWCALQGRPAVPGRRSELLRLFRRGLHDPNNTTSLDGLRRLGEADIPFVRFAVGYGEKDWKVFFDNREGSSAVSICVVGPPSGEGRPDSFVFLALYEFPRPRRRAAGPVGQPRQPDQRADSQFVASDRRALQRVAGDLGLGVRQRAEPNGRSAERRTVPENGRHPARRPEAKGMVVMLAEFAKEVRQHDLTGRSSLATPTRGSSAWHNTAETSWTADNREQTVEVIRRDNPAPLDTLAIHLYASDAVPKELAAWASDHAGYLRVVRNLACEMKRPVFIGEFGLASEAGRPDARAKFEKLLADMEQAEVDLAAFWAFDLRSQDNSWNVTFDNERAYMLK